MWEIVELCLDLRARRRPGKAFVFVVDEMGQYVARSGDKVIILELCILYRTTYYSASSSLDFFRRFASLRDWTPCARQIRSSHPSSLISKIVLWQKQHLT